MKAGEVRKRLGIYYSGEGAHNPFRIELPSGTYIPEFHREAHREPIVVPLPVTPAPERRGVTANHVFAAGAALAVIALVAWFALSKPASALDTFWSPVLGGGSPVQICVAYVPSVLGSGSRPFGEPPGASGGVRAADRSIRGRRRPGRHLTAHCDADAHAAALPAESGQRRLFRGSAIGVGDPRGLFVHALEGNQQADAVLHRSDATWALLALRTTARAPSGRFPTYPATGGRGRITRSSHASSIPILTPC